ncbi:MAG: helix-turn-helix transcriptional regulator [Clostridia bacterium]|nr:helix-turn-helix transcriptional regulator [Clostridia bacterium]
MVNNNELNQKIAKNLTNYRKAAGLTQAELAEKINYSDKSVSKWESGNGIPDVYTLVQIAELYGVSVNAFLGEEAPQFERKKTKGLHTLIMLLSVGIVWLVSVCAFVALQLFKKEEYAWLSFIYAIPTSAIVLIVYASIWKHRILNFVSVSTLIWTVLLSVYLTGKLLSLAYGWDYSGLWCVFLLGVPLQVLEVLWTFFRTLLRKHKKAIAPKKTVDKQEE